MRKLLALLLVILGVASIALGIYGRATLGAAANVTAKATIARGVAYVVIDPGVLTIGDGRIADLRIVAPAGTKFGVYSGLASDINGFIGDSKAAHITGLKDWDTATVTVTNPQGPVAGPNPAQSDNWTKTYPANGTFAAKPEAATQGIGPTALLIAVDGKAAAPSEVSLSWSLPTDSSWVTYALGGGALVLVIGAILLGSVARRNRLEQREAEHARKLQEAAAKARVFDEALVREDPEAEHAAAHSEAQEPTSEPRKREGLR